MTRQKLLYFSSKYIVNFIAKHPVSHWGRDITGRNTIGGDLRPPILGVEAFLEFLKRKDALFTQGDFADFYLHILEDRYRGDWERVLSGSQAYKGQDESAANYRNRQLQAFRLRAKRNFYVSMIDTLHAWALMSEAGWYDICLIDSYEDSAAKTDLTFKRDDECIRVALFGPNSECDWQYKKTYRGNGDYSNVQAIQLTHRSKGIGNKMWYSLADFDPVKPLEITLQEAQEIDAMRYSYSHPDIYDLEPLQGHQLSLLDSED